MENKVTVGKPYWYSRHHDVTGSDLHYVPPYCSLAVPILGDPGAVSGGGKKSKRARKKIGRRKVKNENRSPWDSTLNRPVPKPFKILACDWTQKYFCAQSESSSFRVTFVTSYSKVFTAKLFDRLFAIYLLARAGEFPSIEKCH